MGIKDTDGQPLAAYVAEGLHAAGRWTTSIADTTASISAGNDMRSVIHHLALALQKRGLIPEDYDKITNQHGMWAMPKSGIGVMAAAPGKEPRREVLDEEISRDEVRYVRVVRDWQMGACHVDRIQGAANRYFKVLVKKAQEAAERWKELDDDPAVPRPRVFDAYARAEVWSMRAEQVLAFMRTLPGGIWPEARDLWVNATFLAIIHGGEEFATYHREAGVGLPGNPMEAAE